MGDEESDEDNADEEPSQNREFDEQDKKKSGPLQLRKIADSVTGTAIYSERRPRQK